MKSTMQSTKLWLTSCACVLAMAAVAPSAFAQEGGVERMIVTAQKREQSVQDVSAAVTAVSAARLQNAHINNIEDLQSIVPNIHLGNDFHMAKTFIRGVGANTSTTGSETGVAMHVDGAFVARAEAQLTSLFDLERVEVLRGPQGTLYGRNAVGGSINIITVKPTREFEGYGRFTYGNYDNIIGEGAAGGALSDTLLARVAFKSENHSGFGINPATGNDVEDLSRAMGRIHLNWVPTSKFDILLTGEVYNQKDASAALHFRREAFLTAPIRLFAIGTPSTSPGVGGGFAIDPRDVAMENDPRSETHAYAITGTTTWKANDHISLVNIANFRENHGFVTYDLDLSSRVNGFGFLGSPGGGSGNNSSVIRRDVKSEQFSVEQQFKWASEFLNGVLGLFYFHEVQDPVDTVGQGPVLGNPQNLNALAAPAGPGLIVDDLPPAGPVPFPLDHALFLCNSGEYLGKATNSLTPPAPKRVCIKSHLTNSSYSVFGQANFNLGALADTLSAINIKLGARYSREDVTAQSASIIFAANGAGPVIVTTGARNLNERHFDNFSPEAGIEVKPTENMLLYYTFSRGFKAGAGENNQGPGAVSDFRSIIVDPEIIENHEVGLKSEWFDNRLIVNISGFTYDLRGQQINKTIAGGPAGFSTVFQNAPLTSAKGVELEFTAYITPDFRISGSANWLDSQYRDFLTTDPLNPANISGGTPFPGPCGGDPITTCFGAPGSGDIQIAGNPTRDSPKWSASFHAEYDIRGMNLFGDGGYLTPSIDVMYKSDVFFTEFARLLEGQEAYTLIDGGIRYTSGNERLTADLWIKNATDKLVAASTFQLSTGRVIGVTYLPPRMFGFTVGYKF